MALAGEAGTITPTLTLSATPSVVSPGEEFTLYGRLTPSKESGDTNQDGKIDIWDVRTIAAHFGTREGMSGYNPDYDLNKDGKIDIWDVRIVASNFGQNSGGKPIIIEVYDPSRDIWRPSFSTYTSAAPYGYFEYTLYAPSDIPTPIVLYFRAYFPGGEY